jgi:hypothetical protein
MVNFRLFPGSFHIAPDALTLRESRHEGRTIASARVKNGLVDRRDRRRDRDRRPGGRAALTIIVRGEVRPYGSADRHAAYRSHFDRAGGWVELRLVESQEGSETGHLRFVRPGNPVAPAAPPS